MSSSHEYPGKQHPDYEWGLSDKPNWQEERSREREFAEDPPTDVGGYGMRSREREFAEGPPTDVGGYRLRSREREFAGSPPTYVGGYGVHAG
jgi:hypothetical protein